MYVEKVNEEIFLFNDEGVEVFSWTLHQAKEFCKNPQKTIRKNGWKVEVEKFKLLAEMLEEILDA